MNYYPFHIGDYASATRHLSWDEDMAYRRLLDIAYTTEKPLPLDVRACCRLVLATTEAQREAVAAVLQEFFQQTEEGWVNARAMTEIGVMQGKQEAQRERALKRWEKQRAALGNATHNNAAMPRHVESDAAASKKHADAMPPTPTPTPTPIYSEAKASGAAAPALPVDNLSLPGLEPVPAVTPPPTDRDAVFANGVALLTAAGVAEKNARSFLAVQCKTYGERSVREALDRCAAQRPIQPVPWIQADLARSGGARKAGKHAGFDNIDYREGIAEDGSLI